MHSTSLLVGLTTLAAVAVASPIQVNGPEDVPQGGFSLQLVKKDTPVPSRKRATGHAINNRYWVTLGVGTPPQDLNFLPDSGANNFVVLSTLLPKDKQGDELLYDPSKSSTAKQMNGYSYSECFVSGYCDGGVVYTETVTIGGQTINNVPLMVQTSNSGASYGDRTGNLGLNPDTGGQSTDPQRVPTFMQFVKSSLPKGLVTLSYNTYLWSGSLDFGFVDSNKYTGALTYVNSLSTSTSWSVHFDGMVINGKLVSTPFQAELDHGTGDAHIPRPALDAYFGQIAGANWDAGSGTYTFPCNANLPDMTFSIGLLPLRIPKYSWIGTPIDGANTCRCQIYASDDSSTGFLGETWLQGAFVVFDFDNLRVGFANRPAYSATVPTTSVAGTVKLCTGANFTGNCVNAQWPSNTCGPLQNTQFYHNVGSFSPSVGSCTLYSDTNCASPLPYAANIHSPGISNTYGSGPVTGSYMCLFPSDYRPTPGAGNIQLCSGIDFSGNCQTTNWNSYACQNVTSALKNNIQSVRPSQGYCYLYTQPSCVGPIQDGAPFVNGGSGNGNFQPGKKVQSFMCT